MTGTLLQRIANSASFAVIASITIVALAFMSFVLAEPQISRGQVLEDTSQFTIRQQIVDESSFTTNASNVIMAGGGINGLTGGAATGTTGFTVRTNNATGWHVTIDFFDNAGAHAMYGDTDGDESIRDFVDLAGEPRFGFPASTSAQFGYSVYASSSAEIDQSFLSSGGSCNQGAGSMVQNTCWKAPSTSEFTILTSNTSASAGASSTLTFKVVVPNAPDPIPSAQWYTATATLSLYTD